jgi:dolichyl-phosphate-mannose--protein O-mannosyl transferase
MCFTLFWLNLLPFAFVHRAAFLYHYLPALFYAELLTVVFIDGFGGRLRVPLLYTLLISSCLCYCYFAPWVYAIPLSLAEHQSLKWISSW